MNVIEPLPRRNPVFVVADRDRLVAYSEKANGLVEICQRLAVVAAVEVQVATGDERAGELRDKSDGRVVVGKRLVEFVAFEVQPAAVEIRCGVLRLDFD